MTEPYTLLTIEDEDSVRRSIRAFFEDMDVVVLEAADGKKGIALFREHHPGVVLVDLRMPGMSGLDVIEVLSREAPEVPLVVLSGTGVVADAIEAIRRGAWDYVLKPIKDMAELDHTVKTVLERARLKEKSRRYYEHLEKEVASRTKELQESEQKYRDLVENINDVFYRVDKDGMVSYISPVFKKLAGYEPHEVMGRNFWEFFEPEEQNRVTSGFYGFLAGERQRAEHLLASKSGQPIWVRISSRLLHDGEQVVGVQGILSNITHRKLADEQLKAKARELELLNRVGQSAAEELSVEAIVDTSLKGMMEAVGPDLALAFLKEDDNLVLKHFLLSDNAVSPDVLYDFPVHRVGECLSGIALSDGEGVYSPDTHADLRCTHNECKKAGLRSFVALPLKCGGEILGVLGLASREQRDFQASASFLEALANEIAIGLKNAMLFEKARADAIELQARLAQIQEAQHEKEELMSHLHRAQKMEAIGTLAGGIAHDFNNILTPILMGTELALLNIPPDSPARSNLKRVKDAGARAKELVKQILTFSRQGDMQKGPMRIGSVLKETMKLVRAALPSTIDIRQNIRTENDTVLADPTQVHQVIVNLVTNAAHAMRDKGGVLEITLDEEVLNGTTAAVREMSLKPGPFVKLTVRDTGYGMDRKTMDQIFDPFFTTKKRGEGTGLGLATVHGIVRSCEGTVLVESKLGKGSLFTVYLPRITASEEEKRKEGLPIPCGTERILFVDDELMIAETYTEMLRYLGYQVEFKTDPVDALDVFRSHPEDYDLVITDMTMPRMTGAELGAEVMRIRPGIPVILCTGFSEAMPEKRAMELGFSSFALKPIVIEEIAQKIRKSLDGAGKTTRGDTARLNKGKSGQPL